ncbi:MAG: type II secretion system protein GspH [Deltaproteobacteria bacterium RBG_16_48_10]|nr:MAG: type II secretion system protein GspH [Deltaproteobacteria bacterium RBG_16_48_10]
MKDRGFSLLELTVVLVLLSLFIALIAPSLSRFSKSVELKASAKKVAAILRYYRSEAINKGKVYQVFFDSNLMEVKVQSIESEDQEETGKKEATDAQKTFFLPVGVQMKELNIESTQYPSDLPAIEFYPNGGSNGGDILLDTQSQKGYKIKVNFLTGTVAIEKI